jgi:hypothetical protein
MTTASGIESIGRDAMGANAARAGTEDADAMGADATGGVIEAADVF